MSHEIVPLAYKTKLGNLPAKSILALLADQVNPDGYGWPSVQHIADRTEVKQRTVLRIIQVLVMIGLLEKVDRGVRKSFGLQLSVGMLGRDLRHEFSKAYAKVQRQPGGEEYLTREQAKLMEQLEAMVDCVEALPTEERAVFDAWDESRAAGVRTSSWPGFDKYLN